MWPNHANLVTFKAEILNGKFHVLRIVSCRPEFCNFIKKESPAQVFSCEFHNIFKNISFTEHLCMTDFFDSLYVKIIGCSKSSQIISWSDHENFANYSRKQPPKVFYEKHVLKSFATFTGKHLWQTVGGRASLSIVAVFRSGKFWKLFAEAATRGTLLKKATLKISLNSQEKTCGREAY